MPISAIPCQPPQKVVLKKSIKRWSNWKPNKPAKISPNAYLSMQEDLEREQREFEDLLAQGIDNKINIVKI
jgi:hypothetical protein